MKITNHSKARQGIRTDRGLAWVNPGETREVAPSERGLKQARRLKFLTIEGARKPDPVENPAETVALTDEAKTPAEVLAMFGDKDVHFMTAKAEAANLLGDDMPKKKADIIAALEELATKP